MSSTRAHDEATPGRRCCLLRIMNAQLRIAVTSVSHRYRDTIYRVDAGALAIEFILAKYESLFLEAASGCARGRSSEESSSHALRARSLAIAPRCSCFRFLRLSRCATIGDSAKILIADTETAAMKSPYARRAEVPPTPRGRYRSITTAGMRPLPRIRMSGVSFAWKKRVKYGRKYARSFARFCRRALLAAVRFAFAGSERSRKNTKPNEKKDTPRTGGL